MKKEIKFRALKDDISDCSLVYGDLIYDIDGTPRILTDRKQMLFTSCIKGTESQLTGLKDKNGKEIYEGDVLRFADKWEWYRGTYAIKMLAADEKRLKQLKEQYAKEPFEERVVDDIRDSWVNNSEIQIYWEVIGNIYENPELLKQSQDD